MSALALVYNNDDEHMTWAASRLGRPRMTWPSDTKTIGVESDGKLLCVVLYNLFLERGCAAHIVTDKSRAWATRPILRALFSYPFVQLDLQRLTLPVPSSNVPAMILAIKLGFQFEGRLANSYANGDADVLLGMQRSQCRWLARRKEA